MRSFRPLQYHLDRYEITVDDECYLVGVRETAQPFRLQHKYSDLPSWVFQSKHAVWLTEEDASIRDRALRGRQIKREMLSRRQRP